MKMKIPSFAKINLALRILGRRDDGYHLLDTIFQTLEFHDELEFNFIPGEFSVRIYSDQPDLSDPQTNLIGRALKAFQSNHPFQTRIEVVLRKRIPAQSGLGGGSSNAAAALIAVSRHLNWPLSLSQLQPIATSIGA